MNILIVDDSEDGRMILKKTLLAAGHHVRESENGKAALALARHDPPDLIISDILMPEMDGFQFCHLVRLDETLKQIPFIFYTATYTDARDEKLALEIGADRFIRKPLDSEDFLSAIQTITRDVAKGRIEASEPELEREAVFLRHYNARLIQKLEKKLEELEKENLARKEAETRLAETLEAIPDMILRLDQQGRFLDFKPTRTFAPLLLPDQFLCSTVNDVLSTELARLTAEKIQEAFETGTTVVYEYQLSDKDQERTFEARLTPVGNNQVLAVIRDITLDHQNRKQLAESERRYRELFENNPDGIAITTIEGEILDVNKAFFEMFGYSRDEILNLNAIQLYVDPGDRKRQISEILDKGSFRNYESKRRKKDGTHIIGSTSAVARLDALGRITGFQSITRDVTELRRLEQQFLQAQKMESVGHLAGGVAHDFNNMLSIILGYSELALMKLNKPDPLHKDLSEIRNAAMRSADLVCQLLAFARQQPIVPQILDLNGVIKTSLTMLGRLIGEDIQMKFRQGKNLWNIKMDPAQINQILTNLAVNARDAIGGTGNLMIETFNISLDEPYCRLHLGFSPGEYVALAVSDTGSGMTKEVMDNIFEPFFTTKSEGKGTGLGLSTVYGIIKQNNGFINAYSEPGFGTTFKLFFPRHKGKVDESITQDEKRQASGHETILIVEDDEMILELCAAVLTRQGYYVLSAPSPDEAILISEKHGGAIDLLLTDVVMPTMNGKELKNRIAQTRPEIRSLFMSGYTSDIIAHRGVIAEGAHFIQKPFSVEGLSLKVRDVLDEKSDKKPDC